MLELHLTWKQLPQMILMAALVATLLWVPLGAALALFCYFVLGVPVEGFITFAGRFNAFVGILAWWALAFLASLIYSAFCMPE